MVHHHLKQIDAKAIYSSCGSYRYQLSLTYTGKEHGQTLCIIMQNPSVAGSKFADKSVQFLEKLIFEKDYPQFRKVSKILIVNQFARIQTKNFKGRLSDVGPENDEHLQSAIRNSDGILLAWGKNNPFEKRQQDIMRMIEVPTNKKVWVTKKHPSRGYYQDFIMPHTY
jgi:hypothetical protein